MNNLQVRSSAKNVTCISNYRGVDAGINSQQAFLGLRKQRVPLGEGSNSR